MLASPYIEFQNTPFSIGEKHHLHCQFGDKCFGKKDIEKPRQQTASKQSRLSLQGTRKIGCPAGVHIHEYVLYPEYSVNTEQENNWQMRNKKEEN